MSLPLVSFVTPAYNQERYISDCIRSALAQTYSNWEMVIIDDGSTDRTPEVIKSFHDSRIRYFRQDNLGGYKLGVTYNRALRESRGELIAILEHDDFVPPDKLAVQVPYFSAENVVLAYGECLLTNKTGDPIIYKGLPDNESIRDNRPVGSALREFVKYNFISSQTVMIRKEALLKIGGFIQPASLPFVDYPTWCRLALVGEFKGVPHILGYFRKLPEALSAIALIKKRQDAISYIDSFLSQYENQIRGLGLSVEELRQVQKEYIHNSGKEIEMRMGWFYLVLGMNAIARQRFYSYLRQHHKDILPGIMSLIGLMCSISGFDFSGIYSCYTRAAHWATLWAVCPKARE